MDLPIPHHRKQHPDTAGIREMSTAAKPSPLLAAGHEPELLGHSELVLNHPVLDDLPITDPVDVNGIPWTPPPLTTAVRLVTASRICSSSAWLRKNAVLGSASAAGSQ
jgi:hypothetical protein